MEKNKGNYLLNKFFVFLMITISLNAAQEITSSNLTKQKIEIKELKKELNDFYNQKEDEYKARKKELEIILMKIEKEKKEIEKIHDENLARLQDIQQIVKSKTTKIYNSMKPKIMAGIFNEMINNGKIEDVFDIILRIKEKKVTLLMKFLSVPNASKITILLKDYNKDNK